MGTLYLVATPIGNLEDISLRALRILKEAGLIAAEDTRRTKKLLAHYDIQSHPISYFEHNKLTRLDKLLATLEVQDVALVSDGGMPGLNDPGYELVRAALEAGHTVCPVPGPSAPVAALVASGLPTDAFLYLGFLPRKRTERRKFLAGVACQPFTLIFLEAPHRLLPALEDLLQALGDRPIAVARELTKLHEEIFRGTITDAVARFTQSPPRGEITLVVGGQTSPPEPWPEEQLRARLREALSQGMTPSNIAKQLARESGWARRVVYRLVTALSGDPEERGDSH